MYREIVDDKLKCKDCGEWKPLNHFQKHKSKNKPTSQIGSYCKACKRARSKVDLARLRYGISPVDLALLEANFPVCAICGDTKALGIDHNHITKQIRGRLCKACNTAIGLFKEELILLDSAKAYLTHFQDSVIVKS